MPTFLDFVRMPDSALAKVDVLEMNAACASGLPGGESFDYPNAREFVDWLAQRVKVYTRSRYTVFESRSAEFGNSKPVFRILSMVTVLQRDEGIMYDPALMNQPNFFRDARNVFAHGALDGRGTCSSLPVVFVAVGRRLNYPLKLVSTKSHLFARWDDPKGERFNVECTSKGFVSHPNDWYLRWPGGTHPDEARAYGWLQSKSPQQELAFCLAARGHCLLENLRFHEAAEAHAYASEMEPSNGLHECCVEETLKQWEQHLQWLGYGRLFPYTEPGPLDRNRIARLPLHLAERMNCLKRVDDAIAADARDRKQAQLEEEARRRLEAALPPIKYHYSYPPGV